jgi:hypothetical protein
VAPYTSREFDAVFIYENVIDTVVTGTDPIPATAHAVDITGLDSTNLNYPSQKQFVFKSYPLQPEYVAGAIEFPTPGDLSNYVPDPAGYSGLSFYRWQGLVEEGGPFDTVPGEVVFPRARNGTKGAVSPPQIKVADASTIPGDVVNIIDHVRTNVSTSSSPGFTPPDSSPGGSGYIPKPAARFEPFFVNFDGSVLSNSDLPSTIDSDVFNTINAGPWGFGAQNFATWVNKWDGGYASAFQGNPNFDFPSIDFQEVMFGDADLDGDIDGDDEAIFQANLDNDLNGLADVGGAFLYEVGVTTDNPDTPEVEPAQPVGYGTWLLGDFNNDGFITDADGIYFSVGLPGDGNGDGWVDGLDYLLWAGNFGTHPGAGTGPGNGDYNDDGWVDGLDYLQWAGNFGSHNASAVPEPSTLVLMVLAMAVGTLGVRRR